MRRTSPYRLIYDPEFVDHWKWIEAKYRTEVREAIEKQLAFDANVETRNRKPLKRPMPFDAHWELRCGPNNRFRVFYSIDDENGVVLIVAIGEKVREQIRIAGREIES